MHAVSFDCAVSSVVHEQDQNKLCAGLLQTKAQPDYKNGILH
jgi:hypothetical protein